MGLLDRWLKKKEKDQLSAVEKKDHGAVASPEKKVSSRRFQKKTERPAVAAEKAPAKKETTGQAYRVLLRPIVSEKAARFETIGSYSFAVNRRATKRDIRMAVNDVYGVLPEKVRVMNVEGKQVRFGRSGGRRADWKKAVVRLPKGRTINIHEGV